MIPDWLYPAIAVACIALIAWRDERKAARLIENFRAIEAERTARENTRPHGNVKRVG